MRRCQGCHDIDSTFAFRGRTTPGLLAARASNLTVESAMGAFSHTHEARDMADFPASSIVASPVDAHPTTASGATISCSAEAFLSGYVFASLLECYAAIGHNARDKSEVKMHTSLLDKLLGRSDTRWGQGCKDDFRLRINEFA